MDLFVLQHQGLVQIHRALTDALRAATDAPAALAAGRFLLGHHHAESSVLFPGLRRHGQLRSADLAFLDARDREHQALHQLCERLLAEAGAPHPRPAELGILSSAILERFLPHIEEEEAGLAPDRLRLMIDVGGLEILGREIEALRKA